MPVCSGKMEFAINTVVWAQVEGFPWWPGVVVPREYKWFSAPLKEGDSRRLDAGGKDTRCVHFFADGTLSNVDVGSLRTFHDHPDLQLRKGRYSRIIAKGAAAAAIWIKKEVLVPLPYRLGEGDRPTQKPAFSAGSVLSVVGEEKGVVEDLAMIDIGEKVGEGVGGVEKGDSVNVSEICAQEKSESGDGESLAEMQKALKEIKKENAELKDKLSEEHSVKAGAAHERSSKRLRRSSK